MNDFLIMVKLRKTTPITALILATCVVGCYQKQPVSPESQALALYLFSQPDFDGRFYAQVHVRNNGPDTIHLQFCSLPDCTVAHEDFQNYEIGPVSPGSISQPVKMLFFGDYYY